MEDTKYLPELLAEKDSLDSSFTHAMKLITAEIERIQKGETKKTPEKETYLDLFATKTMKLKERVLIPTKQYPRVNFVGKLLGPQGSTIKRLQEETGAKISVLGKGSMRDKNKEEELRKGGESKYAHLAMELHVFIEVTAPIPENYLRMAHAMDEVKKFLIPEPGEHDPYMDPQFLNGSQDGSGRGRGGLGRGRVDHLVQEGQGDEGCHVEISGERCVEELPVAGCLEETRPEGPRPVGVDHPLLQLEEGPPAAPGRLRAERKGCSPPQPCPIKQVLQDHSPNLNLTMNMVHMRNLTQSLPTRDMIVITVSSLLQPIRNTTITDTVKPRIHHMRATVRVNGITRGPAPGPEAKLPRRGSPRVHTGSIHTSDTEQLPVESCYGNCLPIVTGLTFQKVIRTVLVQLIDSTPAAQACKVHLKFSAN
uniref:KH domain-containing, RNA-binding, signal transduction-associated protein 1 n=1 Tax=Poecilia mexicana TaxID=48701 RepID=A0A3B3WPR1_9TELE